LGLRTDAGRDVDSDANSDASCAANEGIDCDTVGRGMRRSGAQRKLRGKIQVPMVLLGATVSA